MITSTEKKHLREALDRAFEEFIALFSSFGDDDINRVPFPDSWTPGQVALHIILATDGLPDRETAASDRPFDAYLPKIRPWWEDLNQKFQSPVSLTPDTKSHLKHELLTELHRCRKKDLAIIEEGDLTTICLDTELPTIGFLTRYEWLWFIEMHLKRHVFQLKNMAVQRSPCKV
jgi:hypothetical protein